MPKKTATKKSTKKTVSKKTSKREITYTLKGAIDLSIEFTNYGLILDGYRLHDPQDEKFVCWDADVQFTDGGEIKLIGNTSPSGSGTPITVIVPYSKKGKIEITRG